MIIVGEIILVLRLLRRRKNLDINKDDLYLGGWDWKF